jgi:hypothetical protein
MSDLKAKAKARNAACRVAVMGAVVDCKGAR